MKGFIAILTLLACVVSFSLIGYAALAGSSVTYGGEPRNDEATLAADGRYSNIVELYQYWEVAGYPDDVGGVFSTDGDMDNLTVLLTGDDEAASAQIRAMLSDDSGVTFGTAVYSHNELMAVNNEIVSNYMGSDDKIYGVGVGWTSAGGVAKGFGESGYESRVVVSVDASVLEKYEGIFRELYGDMVFVEASDALSFTGGTNASTVLPINKNALSDIVWLMPLIISMVIVSGAGMLLIKRTRHVPVLQTTKGPVVTLSAPVSRAETIKAIKNSEIEPNDVVLQSVLHWLDNNGNYS